MKYFTIILLLSSTISHAQWHIGGKTAVAFSNYKSKTPWRAVANNGFAVGLAAVRQIKPNLGLNVELEYIRKGYYHKVCNTITDRLNTNFLEIPIMIDYSFAIPSAKNLKGHLNLGAYGAYWLNGKYKTSGFDVPMENFNFEKNRASRFDFGPNAGARIEYVLLNGSLSLDFRFEKGLIDLEKRTNDNTNNTNQSIIIGISYMKLIGF
jgi:hypothetical protein